MTRRHTCESCGQPVEIMSSDEGTSYYRGLAAERIERLRDILETLVDLQNGPPLPNYHDEWNAVMARAYQVLERGAWEAQR